jgi:hypothetical protein
MEDLMDNFEVFVNINKKCLLRMVIHLVQLWMLIIKNENSNQMMQTSIYICISIVIYLANENMMSLKVLHLCHLADLVVMLLILIEGAYVSKIFLILHHKKI